MSTGEDELPPLPANPVNNPSPEEDDLPPLPRPLPFRTQWSVNNLVNGGNGQFGLITPLDPVAHTYTYKAPAQVPSNNIVTVTAKITGLRQWVIEGGSPRIATRNEVTLLKQIKIKPNEYNYTLKLELKDGSPCAYLGHLSVDKAEMDIKVKNSQVTITNIVNHAETINPAVISVTPPGTNGIVCSVTCDPAGGAGYYNVASGTGTVDPFPLHSRYRFTVVLKTTGASTPASTVVCTGLPPAVANSQTFNHEDSFTFVLADSTQDLFPPAQYGFLVKLTPK